MILTSPQKAKEYFEAKLEFTTGPIELNAMMEQAEDVNIIDVRAPQDYAAGHIPGAINLPQESWSSGEGLSPDKVNIFYCYSGVCHLAAKASKYFAEHEYPVMELEGGYDQWQRHNLPVES
jgi:rhodanese-related sulfurtransferase